MNLCVFLILLGAVTLQANEAFERQERQNNDEIVFFNDDGETLESGNYVDRFGEWPENSNEDDVVADEVKHNEEDFVIVNEFEDKKYEEGDDLSSANQKKQNEDKKYESVNKSFRGWHKPRPTKPFRGPTEPNFTPTPTKRPTFPTYPSSPNVKPTAWPPGPTFRPPPTPGHGGIYFPDSGEDPKPKPRPEPTPGPQPTSKPHPTPKPTPNPKPTPRPEPTPSPCQDQWANKSMIHKCMQDCYMSAEDDPVCGDNGVNYINPSQFACARKCGIGVKNFSCGPCKNKPSEEDIKQCLTKCPVSTDYSPVCGTDGQTYLNNGLLACARYCGVVVELQSKGPCPGFTPAPTPKPTEPMKEPDLDATAQCMRDCIVTSEYAPLCGSNGVTYANSGRMLCAKECGIVVEKVAEGRCRTPTTKTPPIVRVTTLSFLQQACRKRCETSTDYSPVCGSDYITYNNPMALYCAQYCGSDVQQLSEGECPKAPEPTQTQTPDLKPPTPTSPLTVTPTPTTPSSNVLRDCIRNCPDTPEYNPVCGTDYVTYNNPGRLNCAQYCGADVKLLRHGPCPKRPTTPPTVPSPPTTIAVTTQSSAAKECIAKCPQTTEDNPVCGTDYVTYKNPGTLYCAQIFCSLDVQLLRHGPCPSRPVTSTASPTVTPPPTTAVATTQSSADKACVAKCPATPEYNPVCGTDYVTYKNPGTLYCAQIFCGIDVKLLRHGPCPRRPDPSTDAPPTTVTISPLTTVTIAPLTTITAAPPDPTTSAVSITTQSSADKACVAKCPATPEYNPVCGTDYVTYKNPGTLYCAQIFCGINVSMLRHGPCPRQPPPAA